MDWADDITYAVHDLEDFYRAGLIPLHNLGPHWKRFRARAKKRLGKLDGFESAIDHAIVMSNDTLVRNAVENNVQSPLPTQRASIATAFVQAWRSRGSSSHQNRAGSSKKSCLRADLVRRYR